MALRLWKRNCNILVKGVSVSRKSSHEAAGGRQAADLSQSSRTSVYLGEIYLNDENPGEDYSGISGAGEGA